jgi:hypothetical protein
VVLRDLTARAESLDSSRLQLRSTATVEIELSVQEAVTSAIDGRAVDDLPVTTAPAIDAEPEAKLGSLLEKLRRDIPPPAAPAIVVTHRSKFVDIYLEAERLVEQVSIPADDGALVTLGE